MYSGDVGAVYSNQSYEKALNTLKKNNAQNNVQNSLPGKKDDKLYNTCVEFESIMIKQMLNVMRKSVEKSGFINGGPAEEIFEDMLYDEYALLMAKNSGLGLASMIYSQLSPQNAGIINPQSTQKEPLL